MLPPERAFIGATFWNQDMQKITLNPSPNSMA
jgi:hypothetical protein